MTRSKSLLALAAVALAAGLLAASALAVDTRTRGEKVRLRLRLEKGNSYGIKMTIQQKVVQKIQGNQVDVDQTLGMEYTFDVKEVKDDGTMTAEVTYHAVQMKMDGPTGKVDYDSAEPPDEVPKLARGMAALVGQSFTLDMTAEGRVTRVEGIDALLAHMIEKLKLPAGAMKTMMEDQLKKQFGDKAMRETMEQLMAMYPDKPVGIGDSWTRKVKVTKGFPLEMENTYVLKDRKGGVAILDTKSTLKSDPKAEPMKMGPLSISYALSGKQEGQVEMDEATGWTLGAKLTQEFSGTMTMEGAPGMTGPMSWPVSAKSTITLTAPKRK